MAYKGTLSRAELRKMFRDMRLHPIRPEMLGNPLLSRSMKIMEDATLRYERTKRILYRNTKLTDEQRWIGWQKAEKRREASYKKADAIHLQYQRKYLVPMLKREMVERRKRAKI